jgi:medium-chain acyl-[acyl-carrier-protein] hydrolase
MIYTNEREYDITDYGADKLMRLDAILKIFQETAVAHSDSIGYSADSYMGSGQIWLHNKNIFKVNRLPDYRDKVSCKTWSRGINKFKGFRNYELYTGDEKCIEGSSIWIYIDIAKKRPIRPTQEMIETYDSEEIPVLGDMIMKYNISEPDEYTSERLVTLRPSDFDVNGHVSNIVYGQLIGSCFNGDLAGKFVGISYVHEIKFGVEEVMVKKYEDDERTVLAVYNGEECSCIFEVKNG